MMETSGKYPRDLGRSSYIRKEENFDMPTSFLNLPSTCKDKIYALSGLVRSCPIDLKNEHLRAKNGDAAYDACSRYKYGPCTYLMHQHYPHWRGERERSICHGPLLQLSLFRVCKEISLEASSLFYSSNKFYLRVEEASDLFHLLHLSPHTISLLRSLSVDFVPNDTGEKDSDQVKELLRQWPFFSHNVAKHVAPTLLSFALTFESADLETARRLLATIECLPQLKSCALSLGPSGDPQLRSDIRATGARLTGKRIAEPAPFPFEQLSKELRLMILEKTGLIQWENNPSAYGSIYIRGGKKWIYPHKKCCSRCKDCLKAAVVYGNQLRTQQLVFADQSLLVY